MRDADGDHYRALALHGGAGRGESPVICHRGELDPIDVRNLERSTVALSIAKLWSEKRETEQLIASSTLLRHLILVNPPDASTISAVQDRLKISTDQPVMLALIAMSGLDRASQTTMIRASAAESNLLALQLQIPFVVAEGGAKHAGIGVCVDRVFDFRKNGYNAIFEARLYLIRLFVMGKKL